MIALPSIAFGGFSGSAKGVTARQVGGRSVLSCKSWPTGVATNVQVARRWSMGKITKSFGKLSPEQMKAWDALAKHTTGASFFGIPAEMSGINLYVRLNVARTMAGEAILADAPESVLALPVVEFQRLWVSPSMVIIRGIRHEPKYKLVVKMSAGQSAGVSSGWSRTVIVSPGMDEEWGEANVTDLYLKIIGYKPVIRERIFLEMYWLDMETGFTGEVTRTHRLVVSNEDAAEEGFSTRALYTMADLEPSQESHVSSLEVDFSTGAPVASFSAICLGHSNIESSEVYLSSEIPQECLGKGMCLGRGMDEQGRIIPQSYQVYMYNRNGKGQLTFAHKGGCYCAPSVVFGAGVIV